MYPDLIFTKLFHEFWCRHQKSKRWIHCSVSNITNICCFFYKKKSDVIICISEIAERGSPAVTSLIWAWIWHTGHIRFWVISCTVNICSTLRLICFSTLDAPSWVMYTSMCFWRDQKQHTTSRDTHKNQTNTVDAFDNSQPCCSYSATLRGI